MTDDTCEPPGRLHCPACDRPVSWAGNPTRLFCSLTCKLIDLGRWLDERYRVPGPALSLPGSSDPSPASGASPSDASEL